MLGKTIGRIAWGMVLGWTLADSGRAQELYHPGTGLLPAAQGWAYVAVPGLTTQFLTAGMVTYDSSALNAEHSGISRADAGPIDRGAGVTLEFQMSVLAEAHVSTNRAGISVILLASDRRGIELGFWKDLVFAQSDNPLFVHAEDAANPEAQVAGDYALVLAGDRYALHRDGKLLLSGPVRDYTPFTGAIDPYETPNLIFFGDDTGSAGGKYALGRIALVPPPSVRVDSAAGLHWTGVAGSRFSVQRSDDLVHWEADPAVVKVNGTAFEARPVVGEGRRFYRVSSP